LSWSSRAASHGSRPRFARRRCRATCNRQSSSSVRSSSTGIARLQRLQCRATAKPTASRSRQWSRVMLPTEGLLGHPVERGRGGRMWTG
jgi:hypothetical protein